MASPITNGYIWTNEQITPANLNAMFTSGSFNSNAVDDSTTAIVGDAIIVKDLGVTAAKLASDSVETSKILNGNVTTAKLASALDLSAITVTLAAGQIETAALADDAGITAAKVTAATQANLEAEAATGIPLGDALKYHPGVAKAYGRVDQAADTHTDSYNVTSVSTVSGTTSITTVTLAVTMANTNYVVSAITESAIDDQDEIVVQNITDTSFDIEIKNGDLPFHFTVHGKLA